MSALTSGIVVDNTDTASVVATGTWASSTAGSDFTGTNVQTRAAGSGDSFAWRLVIPATGSYNVYARWTAGSDRATSAQYTIATSSGNVTTTVDQQGNNGKWVLLGSYTLTAGTRDVTLAQHASGLVVADAVKAVAVSSDATLAYYIHTDQINTPRVITRPSDNKMVWRWDGADPFGLAVADEDPSALGAFVYNLRFAGQYFDKETNLHYNYFRDYDPSTGRYVESDPIGLVGGIATYTYVDGRPLSYRDSTGQCPWCLGALIGGGLNVAAQYYANGGSFSNFDWTSFAIATASGAIGGGVGSAIFNATKSLAWNAAGGAVVGAWTAYGGTVLHNKITGSCDDPAKAAAWGGLAGFAGGGAGAWAGNVADQAGAATNGWINAVALPTLMPNGAPYTSQAIGNGVAGFGSALGNAAGNTLGNANNFVP